MAPKAIHEINGSNSSLPDHVLHDVILPRFSFKTLNRFKCISKECYDLISRDPFFASLQSRQKSPSRFGLVYKSRNDLSFLPDPKEIGVCDSFLKFLEESFEDIRVVSSTNGLLLLRSRCKVNSLYVCNPATKERQLVPYNVKETWFCDPGLAFDPIKSPYRYVVVNPSSHHELGFRFDVFRSDTGTWVRSSQAVLAVGSTFGASMPVYANGVLYWYGYNYLLWYDVDRDKAGLTPIPEIMSLVNTFEIGVCDDQITCCITSHEGVEVWRLMGMAQWERPYQFSWDELLEKNPQLNLSHLMKLRGKAKSQNFISRCNVKPLGFDGRCMYLAVQLGEDFRYNCTKQGKVFSCDMKTGMSSDMGINFLSIPAKDKYQVYVPDKYRVFNYHNNMALIPSIFNS